MYVKSRATLYSTLTYLRRITYLSKSKRSKTQLFISGLIFRYRNGYPGPIWLINKNHITYDHIRPLLNSIKVTSSKNIRVSLMMTNYFHESMIYIDTEILPTGNSLIPSESQYSSPAIVSCAHERIHLLPITLPHVLDHLFMILDWVTDTNTTTTDKLYYYKYGTKPQ